MITITGKNAAERAAKATYRIGKPRGKAFTIATADIDPTRPTMPPRTLPLRNRLRRTNGLEVFGAVESSHSTRLIA
jgi:hypothetical protein